MNKITTVGVDLAKDSDCGVRSGWRRSCGIFQTVSFPRLWSVGGKASAVHLWDGSLWLIALLGPGLHHMVIRHD